MQVRKRNGNIVEFNKEKIKKAIQGAMNECEYIGTDIIEYLVDDVVKGLNSLETEIIPIELIQDTVEVVLMKFDLHKVAKAYILFRDNRRRVRELQSEMYETSQKQIEDIMNLKNIENSNANVDEGSFSGKNKRVLDYFLKDYALNNLIDPKIAQMHRDGLLYQHDLDNYASGCHNCLFVDFDDLFDNNKGFMTRNGDVRKPNDIMTFFQLVAVTFQCASQVQFGGIASAKIDYEGAKYVDITFKKEFKEALIDLFGLSEEEIKDIIEEYCDIIKLENKELQENFPKAYKMAKRRTEKKTMQGAESLFHNLNTLESRAGSQVPFTSINFGTDISPEGRLVSKCLLQASINGIGKFNRTSIFPISIFKYAKGINDKEGTPNYDLKLLALESLSKRIYPNFCNVTIEGEGDPTNPNTQSATMGCRTRLGYDINGMGWEKGGRGNICPVTLNLVDMGIRHGICLGERKEADIEGFLKEFEENLKLSEKALLQRYEWIAQQKARSGFFSHKNGLIKNTLGRNLENDEEVRESMKHGSLALGYIGIAECMKAMFGKTHTYDKEVYQFALDLVTRIHTFAKECTNKHHLNFSCYATPGEGCCHTLLKKMVDKYGVIEGVTDREYITNSHHIPVYDKVSIKEKIDLEAPFSKLATGGYILYVELESTFMNNIKAIEKIIDYAMEKEVYYFALNFPIDTCTECGYSSEIKDNCPKCGSNSIERLRRVTGYLTCDYSNFNKGKIAEVEDRVKHDTDDFK